MIIVKDIVQIKFFLQEHLIWLQTDLAALSLDKREATKHVCPVMFPTLKSVP